MKKIIFPFFFLVFISNISKAQFVEIPDSNFRNALMAQYPSCFNSNGMLDTTCSAIVMEIFLDVSGKLISSLEGIQYFKGLLHLFCNDNQLVIIPFLPKNLNYFLCSNNNLTVLPELPSSLEYLNCNNNHLQFLPNLPNSLIQLFCYDNDLTSLPAMYSTSLISFNCSANKIEELPTLPNALETFFCAQNQLKALPEIPPMIIEFGCDLNQIVSLPEIPKNVNSFSCSFNQLTTLPILHNQLFAITTNNNPLNCLPILPESLELLNVKSTNIKCLPNLPTNLSLDTILPICIDPSDICQVTGLASNKNLDFKLIRNPTNGSVRIELPYNGDGNWILSDISGRQLKEDNIANNEKLIELNLNDLPSGTYFFTLQMDGNASTAKVIKM